MCLVERFVVFTTVFAIIFFSHLYLAAVQHYFYFIAWPKLLLAYFKSEKMDMGFHYNDTPVSIYENRPGKRRRMYIQYILYPIIINYIN
jgi:hypothetical protein